MILNILFQTKLCDMYGCCQLFNLNGSLSYGMVGVFEETLLISYETVVNTNFNLKNHKEYNKAGIQIEPPRSCPFFP